MKSKDTRKPLSRQTMKRHINKDWLSLYPGYGGIWNYTIVKRFDILLVGIYLQYSSYSESYIPTFFITNFVTLPSYAFNFSQRYHASNNGSETWIDFSEHATLFREAANEFQKEFGNFLVDEGLTLSQVKKFLQYMVSESEDRLRNHVVKKFMQFDERTMQECLAVLCAYGNQKSEAEGFIANAINIIKQYNEINYKNTMRFYEVNNLSEWEAKLRKKCSSDLNKAIGEKVIEYKLEKIPNSPLIID